jgi:spore coat protein I
VTNFEKCHNDCQVADLYQFLRKVMEKHDWNINVAYRLVDEYDRLKPLEDDDIDMLVTLLSFPEKFWKIINQYYNAGKAWVPAKNIDKLKIVIEQNMRRRELIDKMCGM